MVRAVWPWVIRRVKRLYDHKRGFPFATNIALGCVPIGALSIVLGPEVSRAFTVIYNRPEIVYLWGVVLILGGVQVARGIAANNATRESAGQWVLSVGWAFYGVSVMIGLGLGGLVAGPLAILVAASCAQHGYTLTVRFRAAIAESAAAMAALQTRADAETRAVSDDGAESDGVDERRR